MEAALSPIRGDRNGVRRGNGKGQIIAKKFYQIHSKFLWMQDQGYFKKESNTIRGPEGQRTVLLKSQGKCHGQMRMGIRM